MRYFILTYGCQMNKSDSERIAAVLEEKSYKPASKVGEADLIVVNMCSVRQSAVDRIYGKIKEFQKLRNKNKKLKIALSGCVLRSDFKKLRKHFDLFLKNRDYLEMLPSCKNKAKVLIPISYGCDNYCSYCVVPYTRGKLICRDYKQIINEAKRGVKEGSKEIWLLGQNVNDYKNRDVNFPKLLKMVSDIPGNFSVYFLSSNPKDFSDELIDVIAKNKKISRYINLPVQSGDDKILRAMNRPYTAEQYKKLVKKIRKAIPNINLSTDIIVGFPGESKSQFENTKKLVKEACFNVAFIAKYSPRPGTAASKLKDKVSLDEKRRRWRILNELINEKTKKLIVILGPTASGKSELAIKLAKKFNGEIVSADSRQVYRGMDIGTGKVTKKEMQGIPHYLLDVASPKKRFDVVQYRNLALKAVDKIFKKKKIPIICGGTGFYIQALVDGIIIPEVKPDWKLRRELEKKPPKELFKMLRRLDPERAKNIDKNNPRRLIRALEIVLKTKKSVPVLKKKSFPYAVLMIGIKKEKKKLKKLIKERFLKWLKLGLIKEVKKLKEIGLSWKKIEDFGIHYRVIVQYLQSKITYKEVAENSLKELWHYTKRQITWFKKDKRIIWVRNYRKAEKLVKRFLEIN